jgi:gas vesicle protein
MDNSKIIVAALAGAAAGAIAALLLAPESGEELRNQIKEGARRITDDLSASIQTGINNFTKGKTQVSDLVNDAANAFGQRNQ